MFPVRIVVFEMKYLSCLCICVGVGVCVCNSDHHAVDSEQISPLDESLIIY